MLNFIWLIVSNSVLSQYNNKLTILHTNDLHSHYDVTNRYGTGCTEKQIAKNECWGGLARLKRAIDNERKKHPNSLLLDAGDQFQGTLFYNYYSGGITAEAMNELGYDIMTLGNHEFDRGPHELANAVLQFKFPIVAANVNASSLPELFKLIRPYVEFSQYKVAVIGYLTPTAPTITTMNTVEVIDPIIPVQNAINELREKGYKRIIGLSHHGYHEDIDLASKTNGLSLIVGGHSHTYLKPKENTSDIIGKGLEPGGFYPTPVKNLDKEITYVVQAGCWGRFLGRIDIEFKGNGYISSIQGKPIELNMQKEVDLQMENKVKKWRIPFDEYAKQVLGSTLFDLPKSECLKQECDLGNWLTDIILHYRPQSKIAFINSGGIRAGLSTGNITIGDIQMMLPFGESIVDIELSGQAIWNLLQASVTQVNPVNGKPVSSTLQVSGIRAYHLKNRLLTVDVKDSVNDWLPLSLTQFYLVSTIGFVAKGGDNIIYPIPSPTPSLRKLDEVVIEYIKLYPLLSHRPPTSRLILKKHLYRKCHKNIRF